ncbi:MAG: AraC family transcriptional regulator [Bacteroidota bacterium]
MENYNKIIESLGVRFIRARNIRILKPVTVENYYDVENTIILLHKGEISFGQNGEKAPEGSLLFIPANHHVQLTYGGESAEKMNYEKFINNKSHYFDINRSRHPRELEGDNYTYVNFEARIFDSVNFFSSLDIPAFVISDAPELANSVMEIMIEELRPEPGKERVIRNNTERIAIEVIRYILRKRLFVEQLATNSTYFKDPRLVNIFAYIKENLSGDLSNKALANVAQVSEDYVGQYFKMLTGINPQDYIEYQRMEEAVSLLRTTKKSIREIGQEVGYKGTAYFCRRFKMMFGIPAGKMRRRESLMNI